jgi:hypothetical protein
VKVFSGSIQEEDHNNKKKGNTMKTLNVLIPLGFILLVVLIVAAAAWWHRIKAGRRNFIEQYRFPTLLRSKILFKHPDLSENQMHHVLEGLRQFFMVCAIANAVKRKRSFGMPSKIVDDAWHEFILMSREYSQFCDKAFGGYLHHAPAGSSDEPHEKGLLRTLHQLKSDHANAAGWAMLGGIPLLFAIDKAMAVEGGQYYDPAGMAELEKKRQEWLQHGGDLSIELGGLHGDGDGCSGGDGGGGGCGGGCGS